MNEERMKILEMVEQQKLSVEDALKLLEAVKTGKGHHHPRMKLESSDVEAKIGKLAGQVDNFAKEFGGKMEHTFKEMEPKLKKATKVVVEKTAGIVNELSKALNESLKNMEQAKEQSCCDEQESAEGEEGCCCGCGCDDENKEN